AKTTNGSEGMGGGGGMRIVLVGGSGHIGTALARHFHAQGHEVSVLTRWAIQAPWRTVTWDGRTPGNWSEELNGADLLINLAGRSVNCRYNATNRREIMESRVMPTRLIGEAIRGLNKPPRIWMNASTATIYRHAIDCAMDETAGEIGGNEADAPPSWRFSVEVAKRWEETFFAAKTSRTRRIALRSAMLMSPTRGGAFSAFLQLVQMGLGGVAGTGTQYVSWIHERDFARAIEHLVAHEEMDGVVNLASPQPIPNREFMRILREAWGVR